MSDDLHDIDDLFKKRLEEYAEQAPPEAWEAVNHALDQQQATLYKNKYKRLKSAALILSALCFLGGLYIAYDVWQHKLVTTPEHKQQNTNSAINETNTNTVDNKNNIAGNVIKNNNQQNKKEQKQKASIDENNAFVSNNILVQKQKKDVENKVNKNISDVDASSTLINANNNKLFAGADKNQSKPKTEQAEKENLYANGQRALPDFDLQPFLSQKKDNTINLLSLQNALNNRKPALLTTGTASTIKIKSRATHGVSLSFFVAPNFSFEKIEDDDQHRDRQGGAEGERDRDEENNFSLSGGILLNYQLNKKISLQSGVSVTAFSTSIAPKTIYAKADNNGQIRYQLNCSLGSAYLAPKGNSQLAVGDSSRTSAGTSQLVYINLPAMVSYQISKGRFSLLPTLGLGLNVLAGGRIKTSLEDATSDDEKVITSIAGLKRTYLNGSAGFGVEYKLTPKIAIGIRPNAKFTLTSVNKEMPVKSYQNYLSAEAGLRIKL